MNCTQQDTRHNLQSPLQKANEDPLVSIVRISRFNVEYYTEHGVALSARGPCVTTRVAHHQARPDGAQGRAGTVANSEPLTFHEPCDSRFGEKQHPIINVMQQVMQRETVHAEERVQSVKT